MFVPRRVVVGIGADGGLPALALARGLAASDAALMLAHIVTPHEVEGTLPTEGAGHDLTGMDLLEAARHALGVPCELVLQSASSVARGLHEVAEQEQADLIVVAAGEAESDGRGLRHVLQAAPCAVAVAPRGATGEPTALRRVAAAYLPTVAGRRGLEIARAVAQSQDAELHAITVVPIETSPWLGPAIGTAKTLAVMDGVLDDIARSDLAALGDVVGHVADGDRVEELVRFSEHVDLLVLGARTGSLRHLLTGSTSESLCTAARCALMVVAGHPGDDAGPQAGATPDGQ